MKLKIAAVLMIGALLLQAQSMTQIVIGAKQNSWLVDAQFLPNVATDLLVADVYVCFMDIHNAGADTNVTIIDKQGSPITFMNATIPSGQTWVPLSINPATGPCRKFKGGIRASAGAANAVSIYMSGVQ